MYKLFRLIIKNRKHAKTFQELIHNFLFFRENREQSIWGSISKEDEKGIEKAIGYANEFEGPIVEIGVLFGHTTQLIANLKPKRKELIAVESFEWNPFSMDKRSHEIFTYRSLRYCVENCHTRIFNGNNKEFYESYEGDTPNLIFIDAGHSYEDVLYDIKSSIAYQYL